jgi:hypothetical protein
MTNLYIASSKDTLQDYTMSQPWQVYVLQITAVKILKYEYVKVFFSA